MTITKRMNTIQNNFNDVEVNNLHALKVAELKEIARNNNIKGFSRLNKNELISLIQKHFEQQEKEQQEKEDFKKLLAEHDHTIYVELVSVSSSGMTRYVDCYLNDGDIYDRSFNEKIAKYSGLPLTDKGIRLKGVGMDMGFNLVYILSSNLYDGDGYKLIHRWI